MFVCWFGLVLSTDAECIRYLEEAIDEPDLRYYLEKWHPANIAKATPPARHACPKCSAHNAVQPKVRPVPARYLLVLSPSSPYSRRIIPRLVSPPQNSHCFYL